MRWNWTEAASLVLALGLVAAIVGGFLRHPSHHEQHPTDWRGASVFVLALGVSTAIVAGFLAAELTNGPITTEEIGLLSTLGGAAIGAVATYIGTAPQRKDKRMTTETPPVPDPEPEAEPTPAPPDEESDQQTQQEPTPPESEEEELEAMTGGEDPHDL